MPRAVIIDDEADARTNLRNLLHCYGPSVVVVGEAESVAGGVRLLRQQAPEIVFLDIRMQDGTGFDLLGQFPHPAFGVIFTTAYDRFALKAFEFNAIDYLVKPIAPEELCRAIGKAQRNRSSPLYPEQLAELIRSIQQRTLEKISLSTNKGLLFLRLRELIRLEASGSYTTFYAQGRPKVMIARSLREYEALLPDDSFFRIHQSHLVNLHRVKSVLRADGGFVLMEDDAHLPVARRRKEAFLLKLKQISIN